MSTTIVDMPKVTQMLDAGWQVLVYKGPLGSYEVRAKHAQSSMKPIIIGAIAHRNPNHITLPNMNKWDSIEECHFDGEAVMSDDFTSEQALTRMAYKVHGEII